MTFEQYWTILVKQWRLLVICFLVVGLGAFIGSKLMVPIYQSTVLVQIAIRSGNNQSDYTSLLASDQLVQTEAQLAISDPVLREVASHYPGLTVELLSKEVTSTPKLNTQLFEIDVLDPSPAQAATLANDVATTLIKQQLQATQQDNSQSQQQIQQDLDLTQQRINATTTQISALQAKGVNQAKIAVLQAQLNGLQQHYSQWQAVLAQLELTQAQSGDFMRIVQAAQPNPNSVRPNILLNIAAGLLAGLFLGMLLAVLFERLDTRVRTPGTLTQLLDWPVLATVWLANSSKKEEVIHPKGRDANVESYRILRTNIGFSAIDKPLHSLVVTSALPRDGKSVVAANLAIFMAKAGKNTLLIDADLRRPTLHNQFSLSADKMGLSNAILAFSMPTTANASSDHQFPPSTSSVLQLSTPTTAEVSLEQFVHSVSIPKLWVMPSGPLPPNPPELLDSQAMQRLFMAIKSCGVEIVIFDTPPLLGLSDASILASKVDGTLVVVDTTRANKGSLRQMQTVLAKAGANVLGCVVNKQRRSRHDTAYSYYYYYYHADEQNGEGGQKNGGTSTVTVSTPTEPEASSNEHDARAKNGAMQ